ncbi:VacJ family lipoprotein [Chromatiaceae bacterium AAb-1]|nr:VacJ family lipoprotein [Chromatiaceae bacterium AAb-1]
MDLRLPRFILVLLFCMLAAGCASSAKTEQQAAANDPRDPLENINRPLWDFNYDVLDKYMLRPATVGYMTVVPKPARQGLKNMADNLGEPASFVNGLLQGKPDRAAVSFSRFLVNSTVGVLGLFDVASRIGLEEKHEDFSQTLAVWGVGNGPYLMLPAVGPSTPRALTGGVVDNLYFPMMLLNTPLAVTRYAIEALDGREQLMSVEHILNDSLDPYSFVRETYFQRQEFKIYDGNPPQREVPEVDEDFLDQLDDF